jgi:alkanesulfonate monooxygenase SsuD/methylene tetrahydromethanopterin reductase-like flavin-dependent oxidoreductase (luciferase family)
MLVTVRIGMTVGGDVLARPSAPSDVVAEARRAEDEGFATAWSVHFTRAYDALTTLAVAGTVTERIELGVGVVPTYPRHPLALAQQAVTAQTFCGGRLTLGVGVSHRPDLWPAVYPVGADETASVRRTRELLSHL